jgi:hypothetical protein
MTYAHISLREIPTRNNDCLNRFEGAAEPPVTNKYLATYLIDHLAGAVAAIQLLEDLETTYADTPLASFFVELRTDITADRRQLQGLIERLHVVESRTRKVSAWLTEQFIELKLRVDDSASGPLRLLESLEIVGLGIQGKLAMWHALHVASDNYPPLQGVVDYERLAQRAEEQRGRVEVVRLEAVKAVCARY